MNNNVLNAVRGLRVEKIEGIMGSRQMTVHAVCHKTLCVICVGGCFPCIKSEPDFVTPGAKLRGGSAHHGEIGHAENGKGYDNSGNNEKNPSKVLFHDCPEFACSPQESVTLVKIGPLGV